MAAGLGFKTFTTGEVLTAGDVNGYLMQGINVFTNATARDAAITAPAEGQFAFTKDTNSLWYYDGAAWVASGATGDIEGVTAGVGISGGGTSGTVTITNSMATAIDAKGDLVAGTGADAFSRLAVGTNGQVLTADSAESTGLKWATASSGGYTLISTTAMTSGTSITLSSIPSTYKHLYLTFTGMYNSNSADLAIRFNSDTGSNYSVFDFGYYGATFATGGGTISRIAYSDACTTDTSFRSMGSLFINNYTSTDTRAKMVEGMYSVYNTNQRQRVAQGYYSSSSAISSITLTTTGGVVTFTAGELKLYGVA